MSVSLMSLPLPIRMLVPLNWGLLPGTSLHVNYCLEGLTFTYRCKGGWVSNVCIFREPRSGYHGGTIVHPVYRGEMKYLNQITHLIKDESYFLIKNLQFSTCAYVPVNGFHSDISVHVHIVHAVPQLDLCSQLPSSVPHHLVPSFCPNSSSSLPVLFCFHIEEDTRCIRLSVLACFLQLRPFSRRWGLDPTWSNVEGVSWVTVCLAGRRLWVHAWLPSSSLLHHQCKFL